MLTSSAVKGLIDLERQIRELQKFLKNIWTRDTVNFSKPKREQFRILEKYGRLPSMI
jgi:hypothetical protein